MLSKDLSLKFKVIRLLDNHDYSSVNRKLIRDTGCSDEYSKRVIKELANYLALKVFEKDYNNNLLKCTGVVKRAWRYLGNRHHHHHHHLIIIIIIIITATATATNTTTITYYYCC